MEARLIELADGIPHLTGVVHIGALRHFNAENRGVHMVPVRQALELTADLRIVKIDAGHVGGYGKIGIAHGPKMGQVAEHGVPDKGVQLADEAVALENGNELPRRNQSLLGMLPAHQRLRRHRGPGGQAVNWLKIDMELPILQRFLHLRSDLLLLQ